MELPNTPAQPWLEPRRYWGALSAATAGLDTPFGAVSVAALAWNAHDMVRRAHGTTIRVATKSVRVRGVVDAVLALPGYSGVLAYTLAEGLWLAGTIDDVVVGYPTVDRESLRALAADPLLASRVTLMVDSVAQLDFIDTVVAPAQRATLRVCLDVCSRLICQSPTLLSFCTCSSAKVSITLTRCRML